MIKLKVKDKNGHYAVSCSGTCDLSGISDYSDYRFHLFSLVDWNGIAGSAPKFVGLKNYIDAFHNADFILSLKNMARMVIISVICHTPIALLMAVAINTKCKGYRIFKALFFVPTVFPLTAVGLMWYFIFMPTGSFNSLLEVIGLSDLVMPWLVDPATAMNTIVFVNVWAGVGYYMVII